jgi:hypothetical protein
MQGSAGLNLPIAAVSGGGVNPRHFDNMLKSNIFMPILVSGGKLS